MLKTDVSNYQKNFAGPAITTGEVSNSHFTNHNYDHNVRMNSGEVFSLPNDANRGQKHKVYHSGQKPKNTLLNKDSKVKAASILS